MDRTPIDAAQPDRRGLSGTDRPIIGVFEGGGIRGLALAGAAAAAMDHGRSFARVLGTSAGALVGSLIAAGYRPSELEAVVAGTDWGALLDASPLARIPGIGRHVAMVTRLGVYRGLALERTWARLLAAKGVSTFSDLRERSLRVVATDLTHSRGIVLPDDAAHYGIDPGALDVALAVRMSAAVPFIFEPVRVPVAGGPPVHVVDGAMVARFPVQLADFEAGMPVVGFRLVDGGEDHGHHEIDGPLSLAAAVITSGMGARETLPNLCSGLQRIVEIPVNQEPLEFDISSDRAEELYRIGYSAAASYFADLDASGG